MNGKKAKMLRRLAREATTGLPERDYRAEVIKMKSGTRTGTVTLFQCTRQVYKALKKDYRRNAKAKH